MYVKDVAVIVLRIIEGGLFDNEGYNVGTGQPTTINELAEIVIKVFNRGDVRVIHEDERPGDVRHSYADSSKLLSRVTISLTSLREGLKDMLRALNIDN